MRSWVLWGGGSVSKWAVCRTGFDRMWGVNLWAGDGVCSGGGVLSGRA